MRARDPQISEERLAELLRCWEGPAEVVSRQNRRRIRKSLLAVAGAIAVVATAVPLLLTLTGPEPKRPEASAAGSTSTSCSALRSCQDRNYLGDKLHPGTLFRRGERLGRAQVPECGSEIPATTVDVYRLQTVDPSRAILRADLPDVVYVAGGVADSICAGLTTDADLLACLRDQPG